MTSPSGIISLPKYQVRLMVADSTTFRTLVGAANQGEALASVYRDKLPDQSAQEYTKAELEGYRPCAIVYVPPFGVSSTVESDPTGLHHSGNVEVRIERNVPEAMLDDPEEALLTWDNIVGAIYDEVADQAREAEKLAAMSMAIKEMPYMGAPEQEERFGVYQGVVFTLGWG